jgi:hypothetical protein
MTDEIIPSNPNANLPDHAQRMQDLLNGISNIANSIAESGGVASGLPFIGINTEGVWAFGQERTKVEENSHWAIDIRTWQHGYIAWPPNTAKERKPLGERMVPANMPLPLVTSLPDVGVAYQLQFAFELMCLDAEDAGTVALFKNGSYGAKAANQALVEEVRRQARKDPSKLCPVVTLDIRDYFHPQWKKMIYNPVLTIREWISFEDYEAFANDPSVSTEAPADTAIVRATPPEPKPEPKPAPRPEPRVATRGSGRPAPEPQPAPRPEPRVAARGSGRPAPEPQPVTPPGPVRRRPGRSQPAA